MKSPELKPGTLRALDRELERARRRYPSNRGLYDALTTFMLRFDAALHDHTAGIQGATASNVYECGIILAAMALRIVEEGDAAFRYANHDAPQVQTDLLDMVGARAAVNPHSFQTALPQDLSRQPFCTQTTDTAGTKCNKQNAADCNFYACPRKKE